MGMANMMPLETGQSKDLKVDEEIVLKKLNKRRLLEQEFLTEAVSSSNTKVFKPAATLLFHSRVIPIPKYHKCSVYKLHPNPKLYLKFDMSNRFRGIEDLANAIGVHHPIIPADLPCNFTTKAYVFDQSTVIPYAIWESPQSSPDIKYENIIVFHDVFDNMFERMTWFASLIADKKNKRIICFHFPGQAYTIYQPEGRTFTNEQLCGLVDSFFYHLEESKTVDFQNERFKFFGIGYGGNILLCYLSSLSELFVSMRHVMLVNSYVSIDETLTDFLTEFIKELGNATMTDPDFPFYFYDYISRRTQAEKGTTSKGNAATQQNKPEKKSKISGENFAKNPITIKGRLCLINGILNSVSLESRVPRVYLPMYIVHSLTNCLVDISHADKIENVDIGGHKGIALTEGLLKRKVIYVEGGHSVLEDNPVRMTELMHKFVAKR